MEQVQFLEDIFKGYLSQVLLGPFLNTFTHMSMEIYQFGQYFQTLYFLEKRQNLQPGCIFISIKILPSNMSNIQEKVCCFELSSVASLDKSHQVKHQTNEQRKAQMKTLNANQHIMQYKHVICCHNCLYLCRTMFNVNHLLLHSHLPE